MSTDQRRKNGGTKPVRANGLNLLDTKKALTMSIANCEDAFNRLA